MVTFPQTGGSELKNNSGASVYLNVTKPENERSETCYGDCNGVQFILLKQNIKMSPSVESHLDFYTNIVIRKNEKL